ncbi:MAG TPA: hypothetical protein DEP99_05630 [Nitrospiraceae bacterium]|nr:hypothetical protein [Nitrospiraceae bacterium]
MPSRSRKKKRHILLIIILIALAVLFLYKEIGKESFRQNIRDIVGIEEEIKPEKLPEIAIVIDDLGYNKKVAGELFEMKMPLTLSIIPQRTYSKWIAEEGHKLGHDIIAHIPMEAKDPSQKLGSGGLYSWMTDREILDTLREGLEGLPGIKGASNHMGSLLTEDERAMSLVMSAIKHRRLFFLDSLTTPKSIATKTAKAKGIKVLKRDVFLDGKDDSAYIEERWQEAVEIARKRGYAIVLAHPRENTINFLKKSLASKERVKLVKLSELSSPQK